MMQPVNPMWCHCLPELPFRILRVALMVLCVRTPLRSSSDKILDPDDCRQLVSDWVWRGESRSLLWGFKAARDFGYDWKSRSHTAALQGFGEVTFHHYTGPRRDSLNVQDR